ncbi:MAG: S8 family serine peptidase [Phycisphaerales bacterium]
MLKWRVSSIKPTADAWSTSPMRLSSERLARYFTVQVPIGTNISAMAAEVRRFDQIIECAETDGLGGLLDGPIPSDPLFSSQYYLYNTGQVIEGIPGIPGAGARVRQAWEFSIGIDDTVVAVLDTGVSTSHPELMGRLVPGQNFTVSPPTAETDDSWYISHGTGCAGLIAAATNNEQGIAGISWRARIMPVKVANTFGMSSESQCANGLIWATDHGASIASISLGFAQGSSFFADAVRYAIDRNVLVCASSGNTPGVPIFYPARFPRVAAVGATNNRDELATFTTTGPEMFMCAPGIDILTTWDTNLNPNGYEFASGTSFACPIVAGVASLVIAADRTLTAEQTRFVLLLTANDLGPVGRDDSFGWGRVNARDAVLLASNRVPNDCGADYNRDGSVNSSDLFEFLEQYLSGQGDYNHDGRTDSDDLFEFLAHFFVGC